MTAGLVAFVRARFNEELEKARFAGNVVGSRPERFGVGPEEAAEHARFSVAAAEARIVLLDDTVVPYLGTAGRAAGTRSSSSDCSPRPTSSTATTRTTTFPPALPGSPA